VGASGSFETITSMIRADDPNFESETGIIPESVNIDLTDFENLYQKLINSTLKERKQMKGLESMRLEMIVVATLIVKFILQKLKINRLVQSNFSLKEGMVYEVLNMKAVTL
jgi:exopolyphosphatase/guanosine-5'-triphosphate,3'-diphosphate pyrophosphatase